MENDENIKHKKRRDSKTTLLSVLGVEDAKKKLKNIAERRRGTISEENQETSTSKGGEPSMLENLKATLADLKAVEAERQQSVQGLQQLEKKKKLNIKIGTTLMTSKAIAIMSSSRKQKMKASVNVSQVLFEASFY